MRLFSLYLWISASALARDNAPPLPAADAPAQAISSAVVPDETGDIQAENEQTASPVPAPALAHYAALWQRSMFTSRALPAPEVPQGPGFADQLVLAGMYEVDGAVVAVILDKMTAQISEARIGSDNAQGIRIKSVEPAGESGLGRVQLQKGMQSGWIQFADASASAAGPSSESASAAPLQPLAPGGGADAAVNNSPRGPALPGGAPDMNPPTSLVQPLPAPPTTPNPNLDDIPLPPD